MHTRLRIFLAVTLFLFGSLTLAHDDDEKPSGTGGHSQGGLSSATEHHHHNLIGKECEKPSRALTYYRDVAPVLENLCWRCHRDENGVASLSLGNYEDAKSNAHDILRDMRTGRMPHGATIRPLPECGGKGRYKENRLASPDEICLIENWIRGGLQEGSGAEFHPKPESHAPSGSKWLGGTPDFWFEAGNNDGKGYPVKPVARGKDEFRNFDVPLNTDSDRFITQIEILPGSGDTEGSNGKRVVHHAILFMDTSGVELDKLKQGALEKLKAEIAKGNASPEDLKRPGFQLGPIPLYELHAWFPGAGPLVLPPGVAQKIPKGAKLIIQMHYTNGSGQLVTDHTQIGFKFARKPIEKTLFTMVDNHTTIKIPKNAVNYPETKTIITPKNRDLLLLKAEPHAHQLGTDFLVSMRAPGGKEECLLNTKWDFNHQNAAELVKPILVKGGTAIKQTCIYDNSTPHRRKVKFDVPESEEVVFGQEADHEMCRGDYIFIDPNERFHASHPRLAKATLSGTTLRVKGEGFVPGALIAVNGKLLMETRVNADGTVEVPEAAWKTGLHSPGDRSMKVTVYNADGGHPEETTVSIP